LGVTGLKDFQDPFQFLISDSLFQERNVNCNIPHLFKQSKSLWQLNSLLAN
jgi:hypothetical protein